MVAFPTLDEMRDVFPPDAPDGPMLVVRTGEGRIAGYSIGKKRVSGLTQIDITGLGLAGVRIIGEGISSTTLHSNGADMALHVSNGVGRVEVLGMTIEGAPRNSGRCVHAGVEKQFRSTQYHGDFLGFDRVHFQASPSGSRWGVLSYNFDVHVSRCSADWVAATEHLFYFHGVSEYGIEIDRLDVSGCGGEIAKVSTRPREVFHARRARLWIHDSRFRNWFQPWSNAGGAGVVLQGAGLETMLIETGEFSPSFDRGRLATKCIMVDDGMSQVRPGQVRFYDLNTGEVAVPGTDPVANGWVAVIGCGVRGEGVEVMRAALEGHPDDDWPRYSCKGYWIKDSGVFGPGTSVNLTDVERGRVLVQASNTPRARAHGERRGWDTGDGARLYVDGHAGTVEQGFIP